MTKILTLTFIEKDKQILLGLKKRGFGMGKYNGFGGKVEPGETIEEGAKREVFEESNLNVDNLKKFAVINFSWQSKKNPDMEVYLFKTNNFSGTLEESEEMKPIWFDQEKIPFKKMWDGDNYWFPYFLNNKNFQAKFIFDDKDKVIDHQITEI
ncbi:MAG: 8-oxo-dGTP diphosphatase [bacterium]|nr:8-oxo-dGTP diphosphatase [bacterium]